ncbi:Membrane associated serine protease, rhomboid family [Flexibacter flexilis DSM 6793]|uniref:Membrane associated serine protease, rhomboid family n=1 Tax=Flexibacter flexilis DSM 6793 TaxID=927664 RepID=A0A1I1MVM0_9BACT|nr:rhomboid family intramembrane serine protease [Flexibacter flexilis]SFC89504.1 Membrane associated serine protease, rhomboid family [Flexibacter flexilis DSM 6793]
MSATIIIVLLTVGVSFYAWNNPSQLSRWTMNPVRITRHREYERFIMSGFIHQDYMHLFFNMLTLYSFGEYIEQIYSAAGYNGGLMFGILYLLGIVVADLPTYFKHKNDSGYESLGASGGVSAVVFAGIVFAPTMPLYIMLLLPIPGFIFAGLYLWYCSYMSRQSYGQGINHDAHFYGSAFGAIFALLTVQGAATNFVQQILAWRF